jgi:CBS domain containing-hemolysin-like protein
MTAAVSLVLTLVLVLLNAFFVASEYAIVKIRPTRLDQLVRGGDARAKLALRMSQRLDAYLSANQLGVTLASLGVGWLGEPAVAQVLEPAFAPLGRLAGVGAHGIALVIAFVMITALHTIIGELAPKSFAIQKTEEMTLFAARPLHAFFLFAWPIIWLLNNGANAFIRLFGLRPASKEDVAHTSEELRMLLAGSPAGLDPALRSMLVRIFDLRRRTARHVMSLRSDASTLRANMAIADAVRIVADAGYSRYPVLNEIGHEVLGYLHIRDLFDVLAGRRKAAKVAELLRKPIFARENTSVELLRLQMQARQIPVAIITAPSNEFVGLVTMEDLLEEIVGEIRDENDEEVAPIHRRGGGLFDIDGRVLLTDLERDAGIVLRPEMKTIETVGGYILARLEHPAESGERIECEGYTLVVTDVAGRRVRRVRIVPTDGGAKGDEAAPPPAAS